MISAIILAAGLSRRMGSHKMLLPYGGASVIATVAEQVVASPVDETIVVVGHRGGDVARQLKDAPVRIVENPEYAKGMLSSVRRGVAAASAQATALMMVLGDQPTLQSSAIERLIAHYRAVEARIVAPSYNGRRGHPLIFDAAYREEILTRFDEVGLRGLMRAHPGAVSVLEVAQSEVLEDLDTPEDYQAALRRLEEKETG